MVTGIPVKEAAPPAQGPLPDLRTLYTAEPLPDPERVVLDDGKFEMLLVPSPKTAADLQNLVLALLNQQYDSQGLVFRHVSSLRLETEEELPWSLDGEYAPSVPVVDIVNRQRALRMLL